MWKKEEVRDSGEEGRGKGNGEEGWGRGIWGGRRGKGSREGGGRIVGMVEWFVLVFNTISPSLKYDYLYSSCSRAPLSYYSSCPYLNVHLQYYGWYSSFKHNREE